MPGDLRDPDDVQVPDEDQASEDVQASGERDAPAVGRARLIAGAVMTAVRAVRHWVGRSARTGRGRVLLAAVTAVALAIPSVIGFLLVSAADDGGGAPERVASIGVMAPLSGASADAGSSVRNAVTLAVEEANRDRTVPGWKLEVVAHDDLSRPDGGAAGADLFADDKRMIGVVGPLSSSVAMVSLDRLGEAGLPVISPSNAEPTLTERPEAPDDRPYPTYFRLSGTDEQLSAVAADYAVHTLGRSRISVVDGSPDYGMITLAERFARDAREAGATVPAVHRVEGGSTDDDEIERTARAIRDEAPDLVYLATGAAFAGELRQAFADEGVSVQVLGADGLLSHDYVERAQSLADGDVITDLSVPASRLPSAGAFVAAYTKRFGAPEGLDNLLPDGSSAGSASESGSTGQTGQTGQNSPSSESSPSSENGQSGLSGGSETATPQGRVQPSADTRSNQRRGDGAAGAAANSSGSSDLSEQERAVQRSRDAELAVLRADAIPPVAAYAYDAARALIRAAAAVLPGRTEVSKAARAAVVDAVGAGEYAGVTGRIAFDARGDLRSPRVALYSVLAERFVPLQVEAGG
nr:branched-chain amino acid ABC transporter substrate-binding protein [Parafrankia irregularis]